MPIKIGIGQDSHRLIKENPAQKPLMLGGIHILSEYALEGNSDADVILHAICNAISSISGTVVLGPVTDRMCLEQGITDSTRYIAEALKTLTTYTITHVAVTIECRMPKLNPHIDAMRQKIAELLAIKTADVGITATTGEGLTAFGQGEGIQAFVALTTVRKELLDMFHYYQK